MFKISSGEGTLLPVFKFPENNGFTLHITKSSVMWLGLRLTVIQSLTLHTKPLINAMNSKIVHKENKVRMPSWLWVMTNRRMTPKKLE